MPDFTPDHEKSDRLIYCPFKKHKHKKWNWVKDRDPDYILWLVSGEGPDMDDEFLDFLSDLAESIGDGDAIAPWGEEDSHWDYSSDE